MDDALRARLEEIEKRLAAIEQRPLDRTTMKESRRCTTCGCAKLLQSDFVAADIQANVPFSLTTIVGFARVSTKGRFEVHVCTKCGLVEWHALELDPSIVGPKVKLIEPPDDDQGGPYR